MSYNVQSDDEVAEDYRRALEDLTMNSRYEISNLTVIAKENNEHAMAISEALKDHIKRVAPIKKLPAFYVLDSIVKNVGTPYTLFFGRNLFSTFMEAYALVDNGVRRKMEEMLKTWKEPVPGSIDTRPVFPVEVTRPIENALIKARTSALQAQQEFTRNQQQMFNRARASATPFRDTPTPPNDFRQAQYSAPPPANNHNQQYPHNENGQAYGHQQQQYGTPQPSMAQAYPPPRASGTPQSWQQSQGFQVSQASLDSLQSDITNLIAASKAEFAQNPYDSSIQTRLKALLDLQSIISSQKLPPEQIMLVKQQVEQLSTFSRHARPQAPQPAAAAPVLPPAPVAMAPAHRQQQPFSSIPDPNAIAAILARASATAHVPTPPPPVRHSEPVQSPQLEYAPPPAIPPTTMHTPVPPPPDPLSLLDQLRAVGMLTSVPSSSKSTQVVPAVFSVPPPPIPGTVSTVGFPMSEIPNDVQLTAASLKIPRPHLISSLYERLGAPCNQCGRRFQSTPEGKKKKDAHMDWHFFVNKRRGEAEKRGQHRSWFVDVVDWIKSRENDDEKYPENTNGGPGSPRSSAPSLNPKEQYLVVPNDAAFGNTFCPICQEKLEKVYLHDKSEWVWIDAVKIGNRIYHASCHSEVTKGSVNNSAYARATPEPVLGKRKAEDESFSLRTKIKAEPL